MSYPARLELFAAASVHKPPSDLEGVSGNRPVPANRSGPFLRLLLNAFLDFVQEEVFAIRVCNVILVNRIYYFDGKVINT